MNRERPIFTLRRVGLLMLVLGSSCLYAIIREHWIGERPWSAWPLTLNGSFSLAAVTMFSLAALFQHRVEKRLVAFFGIMGFALCTPHALGSLVLLTPEWMPHLHAAGRLSDAGIWALLLGIFAFALLLGILFLPYKSENRTALHGLVYGSLFLTGCHGIVCGLSDWLQTATWPGNLPPTGLIAFALTLVPLIRMGRLLVPRPTTGDEAKERSAEA